MRRLLRTLAGIVPAFPEHLRSRPRRDPSHPGRRAVVPPPGRSPRQRHLALPHAARGLPPPDPAAAAWHGVIREGPEGSAWFAHRHHDRRLSGIEMRGPQVARLLGRRREITVSPAGRRRRAHAARGRRGADRRLEPGGPRGAVAEHALPRHRRRHGAGHAAGTRGAAAELADRPTPGWSPPPTPTSPATATLPSSPSWPRPPAYPERLRPPRGVKDWNDLLRPAQAERAGGRHDRSGRTPCAALWLLACGKHVRGTFRHHAPDATCVWPICGSGTSSSRAAPSAGTGAAADRELAFGRPETFRCGHCGPSCAAAAAAIAAATASR